MELLDTSGIIQMVQTLVVGIFVSAVIVAKPGDIRFYVGVPKKLQDMVEKQINGAYPDAHIQEVDDYNIFETENGKVAFTSLFLKKSDYLPIKFYKELPVDPLATIVSTMGKMQEGERSEEHTSELQSH